MKYILTLLLLLPGTCFGKEVCFSKKQAIRISRSLKRCKADRKKNLVYLESIRKKHQIRIESLTKTCRAEKAKIHPAVWFAIGSITTGAIVGVVVWQVAALSRQQ